MSQQVFSKACNQLDHSPFGKMFRRVVEMQYSGEYEIKRWNGWKVLSIDGTEITLPNTRELRDTFIPSGAKADYTTVRRSNLYDVLNDKIMDTAIRKYSCSEREFAKDHTTQLTTICEPEHTMVIFDCGYPSLDLIQRLNQSGMHFLMRVRRKWNPAVDAAAKPDSLVKLDKKTTVRVIELSLPSGVQEVLITSLFHLPVEAFSSLYYFRWPVKL